MTRDRHSRRSRRAFLAAAAQAGLVGLAGCGGRDSDPTATTSDRPTSPPPTATATPTATPTETPSAPAVDGWPLPDGTARGTRHVPTTAAPADPPGERWRVRYPEPEPPGDAFGSYGPTFLGPVTDGDLVFASRAAYPSPESETTPEQYLDAYDRGGNRRWVYQVPEGPTAPAVVDDLVLVSDGHNTLHAVDRADGTRRWSHDRVTTFLPYDESVYVANYQRVASLSLAGEQEWTRSRADYEGHPDLAAVDGTLYLTLHRGLRAHDAATGAERWTASADPDSIRVTNDALVGFDRSAETVTVRDRTRPDSVRWRRQIDCRSVAVGAGLVVVTHEAGSLRGYDLADGTRRWTVHPRDDRDLSFSGAPTVTAQSVLVGGDALAAFAHDGTVRWSRSSDDLGCQPTDPVVVDAGVYVGATDYQGDDEDAGVLLALR